MNSLMGSVLDPRTANVMQESRGKPDGHHGIIVSLQACFQVDKLPLIVV